MSKLDLTCKVEMDCYQGSLEGSPTGAMMLLNNQSGGNMSVHSNSKENLDAKNQVVQDAMNLSFKSGVDNVSKSPGAEPAKDDEQRKEE